MKDTRKFTPAAYGLSNTEPVAFEPVKMEPVKWEVPVAFDIGTCPIVVTDSTTARLAGEWAEAEARKAIFCSFGVPARLLGIEGSVQ